MSDLIRDFDKLKTPFKKQGFLNYMPYPHIQRGIDSGCYIAEYDGEELVGFVWWRDLKKKDVSYIEEIVSVRKGLGTSLLKRAIERTKNNVVVLKVADHNERAIAFYKKNGFSETSRTTDKKINLITMSYEK